MEQEEYTKEEIDWSYIDFIDNQDVLDLLEKVCKFPYCQMFKILLQLAIQCGSGVFAAVVCLQER